MKAAAAILVLTTIALPRVEPDSPMTKAAKEFVEVSGKGTLYCWYICHDTSITGYEDKVPYAVILTELDEQPGLVLMSNILNFEYGVLGEGLDNGMRLRAVYDHDDGSGLDVIQFEPDV